MKALRPWMPSAGGAAMEVAVRAVLRGEPTFVVAPFAAGPRESDPEVSTFRVVVTIVVECGAAVRYLKATI